MTSIPVQELEYHYSPSRWSHRMGPDEVINAHLETTAQGSRNSLWTLDSELEISYGDSERQKFDIFYKKNAPKKAHDSGIYLAGHSAGAHIAAMMLMASLSQYDAFDSDLIKGAVLISGVYDLRPLVKTSNNEALRLSETEAWRFSPLNFVQEIAHESQHRHVVVAVGEYDPPEFRRQSGEMEQMLRNFGVKTSYLDVPDVDHFNIVEKLSESKYILTQECIRLMGL
uniref:Alpha/beta hydrolase fold-3 domain-containing protein n=1 Tax=Biomphalaria glabrata TaxID=6526 RepID=A0A2C9LT27_BIOGL